MCANSHTPSVILYTHKKTPHEGLFGITMRAPKVHQTCTFICNFLLFEFRSIVGKASMCGFGKPCVIVIANDYMLEEAELKIFVQSGDG